MNKYYIGIDGGGSNTEIILANQYGKILKRGITGPSNPLVVGKKQAIQNINKLLLYTIDEIDCIQFITICVPGFRHMKNEVIDILATIAKEYYISADEENVFYASIVEDYGVVVLSGTGSFAVGRNLKGENYSAGGWGYLLGDEGSGYYVGIRALKSVVDYYEGRGPYTSLVGKVKEKFEINNISELRHVLYINSNANEEFTWVNKIASLSKEVLDCVIEGDMISSNIIKETSKELFVLAETVIRKLEMYDSEYPVTIAGGLTGFGEYLYEPFRREIETQFPNFLFKEAIFPPIVGSLLIAYKCSGILNNIQRKNSVINVLKKSYKGVECHVI